MSRSLIAFSDQFISLMLKSVYLNSLYHDMSLFVSFCLSIPFISLKLCLLSLVIIITYIIVCDYSLLMPGTSRLSPRLTIVWYQDLCYHITETGVMSVMIRTTRLCLGLVVCHQRVAFHHKSQYSPSAQWESIGLQWPSDGYPNFAIIPYKL